MAHPARELYLRPAQRDKGLRLTCERIAKRRAAKRLAWQIARAYLDLMGAAFIIAAITVVAIQWAAIVHHP